MKSLARKGRVGVEPKKIIIARVSGRIACPANVRRRSPTVHAYMPARWAGLFFSFWPVANPALTGRALALARSSGARTLRSSRSSGSGAPLQVRSYSVLFDPAQHLSQLGIERTRHLQHDEVTGAGHLRYTETGLLFPRPLKLRRPGVPPGGHDEADWRGD
jgi:hypothetical protein